MISQSTARLLDLGWRAGESAARHGLGFEFCRFVMARNGIPQRARPTVRAAFWRAMRHYGRV